MAGAGAVFLGPAPTSPPTPTQSMTMTMGMTMGMTMTMGRGRSRSRNLSEAGAGNLKNGRIRQPCIKHTVAEAPFFGRPFLRRLRLDLLRKQARTKLLVINMNWVKFLQRIMIHEPSVILKDVHNSLK